MCYNLNFKFKFKYEQLYTKNDFEQYIYNRVLSKSYENKRKSSKIIDTIFEALSPIKEKINKII